MKKFARILLVGALTLSLAACGDDKETESVQKEAETTPVNATSEVEATDTITITDALGNTHEFTEPPATIAALSPGEMDILLALGANVTGRPTIASDMTAEVAAIQEIGNPHEPAFETIATVNPEVLVVPPSFMQFAKNLEGQGTKVIYSDANSVEEIQKSIEMFGTLFQKEDEAKAINDEITTKISTFNTTVDVNALLVYGAPGTYLVALDNSLAGDILNKAGGKNIASDFPATDKYQSYAALSIEKIVERNPQVVMILTHANPEAVIAGFQQQMNENAAWKNLDAVKNDQIIILPADLFGNNPGTKILDSIDYMMETLQTVKQ